MSFGLDVVGGSVEIEPGSTSAVAIQITNRSDEPERYELSVEGLDPTWTAVPVPEFVVEPHTTHSERIFLKPPRESDSTAGTYPYVVVVRSLETGEVRKTQGVLELKSFHHFTIDIQPKRASVNAFRKEADLDVTIINLGNSEHHIQLFATDQDDQFAFEIEEPQVHLAPGQQKTIAVTATASRSTLLANPRLDPITVSGRSLDKTSVSAAAQGQIERRPLLTPASVFFFVAIVAAFFIWLMNMPQTPVVAGISASPREATLGEKLSVTWQTKHADSVTLEIDGEKVTGLMATGSYDFTPTKSGTLTVLATAVSGSRRSRPKPLVIEVSEPVMAPLPEILSFEATSRTVKLGEPVIFRYKLSPSVVRANLAPYGVVDPRGESIQVQPRSEGSIEYTLTAVNSDEKTVSKSITITVRDESDAQIASLEAQPAELEAGVEPVKIRWRINGAVQAQISIAGAAPQSIEASFGELEIPAPTADTTVKIEAFDARGRSVSKSITIKIKQPEPPVDPNAPPVQPTTTGGAPGSTT